MGILTTHILIFAATALLLISIDWLLRIAQRLIVPCRKGLRKARSMRHQYQPHVRTFCMFGHTRPTGDFGTFLSETGQR